MPVARRGAARPGQALIYGLRPELMTAGGDIPLLVDVTEPTGAETHVVGRLGGAEITGVFRDRVTVAPGGTMQIGIDPSGVHLFDEASGMRVSD